MSWIICDGDSEQYDRTIGAPLFVIENDNYEDMAKQLREFMLKPRANGGYGAIELMGVKTGDDHGVHYEEWEYLNEIYSNGFPSHISVYVVKPSVLGLDSIVKILEQR